MANKQSKIRWRESDAAELQRVINNFNAKLYRIKKNHPEMADYLPQRVKKGDTIKSIETRADLNRVLNSLKRFSARGAEEPVKSSRGAKSTKWEVGEFSHKQRIENARRTRERKRLEEKEVKSRGKKTGSKRSEMGSIDMNSLKPSKKKFENLSDKEWELAKTHMDNMLNANYREERLSIMKENYIKGLTNAGYSDELIEMVQNTPLQQFVDTFNTDTEASFDFIYDPIEHQLKEDSLKDVWKRK